MEPVTIRMFAIRAMGRQMEDAHLANWVNIEVRTLSGDSPHIAEYWPIRP
jgi:hypothetical protein